MTNIKGKSISREGVITDAEFIQLIRDLDPGSFIHPYYYMRVKDLCSTARRTRKLREELALLKTSDIEVDPDHIYFVFTLIKKGRLQPTICEAHLNLLKGAI